MRVRLATRPGVLFGALVVVALLALLPMRLVLGLAAPGEQGFSARSVRGSVWAGVLLDAQFGGADLGDLDARLRPLPLLIGEAQVALASRDDDATHAVHGTLRLTRHVVGVEGMTAALAPGAMLAPLPVSAILLDAATIRFRDGVCDRAEGRVRATLAGDVEGVALPALLAGDLRCDGPALVVPMTSQGGGEGVTLRVTGDGRYVADVLLRPADQAATARLAAAGFVAGGGGWRLSVTGRFGQP